MQQTISDIVSGAFANVFKNILSFFTKPLDTFLNQAIEFMFSGLNSAVLTIFDDPILSAILTIINIFSWVIFFVTIFFYLLKIAKEVNKDWATICNCFIEAFLFVTANQLLAKTCFYLSCMISQIYNFAVFETPKWTDYISPSLGFNGFTLLVALIALVGFFVVTIMRAGNMFIQILIAPLYVPYVLMGDKQKWSEWLLGVVSVGFTYVVQYTVFYSGYMIIRFADFFDFTSKFIGIGLLFGTFGVPKAMQKFGWSSGSANAFRSVGQTAATLLMRMPIK